MPLRHRQGLAGLVCVCLSLTAGAREIASAGAPHPQTPETPAAIWSGVYSEAQAKRGLLHYAQSCEHCHGSNLTGDPASEVPSLVADAFMFHWRGRTAQDLYARLSKAMPADAPGTLDAGAYLDLVAYLLEANGFPSGPQDLDRSRLSALAIEKAPPRQP